MGIKQYAFNCNEELIEKLDEFIKNSNMKYRDRTQFIIIAIQEKIEKEGEKE